MRFKNSRDVVVQLVFGSAFLVSPAYLSAQQQSSTLSPALHAAAQGLIPDAPIPQTELAFAVDPQAAQPQAAQPQQPAAPATGSPAQNSGGQRPDPNPDPPPPSASGGFKNGTSQNCPNSQASSSSQPCTQSQYEKARQEVKEQEKQRVEGVIPTFNVTYRHDAVPLTAGQKFDLSFHSAVDPFAFASSFVTAGYHEAFNDTPGMPWGVKGYFERTGAAYLDTFDSDILSTGVFPVIFRQDPRYFRLGPGTPLRHRILYAVATSFIAKNDYNGRWGPNFGNLLGNFTAGEISNLYYPDSNSSVSLALSNTAIQIIEGEGGTIFNEFWPDLSRKFFHKDPTHGLDAQQAAAERDKSGGSSSGAGEPSPK